MTLSEQDWSWAHQDGPIDPRPIDPDILATILVVHNAEEWLARTLVALGRLENLRHLVAVDNGSTDGSRELLDKARAEGLVSAILTGDASWGFGRAVQEAVDQLDEHRSWLWLLHDDVEPQRSSLDELLRCTTTEPAPDLVIPKLLQPRRRNHPDRIAEVGQTISAGGHRVLAVDDGDLDQQQTTATEVLGGSSAGLLVRRSAWQQLGGMDPAIPLFRDGVELGWRANEAGLRVVTCPAAAIHHRRAGRTQVRESALAPRPDRTDRMLGHRLVAAHSARPALTTLRLALGGLLDALGHLLGKAPGASADALGAVRDLLSSRRETAALHQRLAARGEVLPVDALRPPRWHMLRHRTDRLAGWVADRLLPEAENEVSLDELTAGEDAVVHENRRSHALAWLVAAVVLLTAVAGRRLFGLGELSGPALAPAPAHLTGALDAWLRSPHGAQGANPTWLGIGALGSLLALGRPDWFAVAGQLLAVPLAMLASLPLWRRLLPRREPDAERTPTLLRRRRSQQLALLAAAWGLVQPVLGLTGSGRPSSLLLAVVLPLAAACLLAWWQQDSSGVESWRAPAGLALCTLLASAAVPVLWLVALVAAVVVARRRGEWSRLAVLLVPLLALAPWLVRCAGEPARLLTGSDPRLVADGAPWWVLLPGALLLWLAALAGSWRRPQPWLVALAVVAWALGTVLPKLWLPGRAADLRPDGDGWLLIACLTLLAMALQGWSALPNGGLLPLVARLGQAVAALLALFVALAALWWAGWAGAGVHRSGSELPAHVVAVQDSVRRSRALAIDLDRHGWNLVADDQPRWGSAEQPVVPEAGARGELESLVHELLSGASSDQLARRATALDIGHLWIRGADEDLVAAISDSPGLGPAEQVGRDTTWTVVGPVTRQHDWYGPRAWWPAGLLGLCSAALLLLAAPSSQPAAGPRRAREDSRPTRGVAR
ncbi:glycosyltransferase family 2 protein [Luteococcus peritonei]|uniref:Glycosyltransferase n=1 Tax=Luteococcus peritonei TaxID=88874 RepID=A0ABW4RXD2_9ACTN